MPFMGSLSDILGRREILFTAVVFFTAGSIVAARAGDMTTLLVGRVLQGVGGAGILPMAQIVLCDIIPLRYRPKYASVVQLAWALGTILAPLIGGLIVAHTTWRWIFYLNIPFCAIAMTIVPLAIRLNKKRELSWPEKLLRVDWVGAILFVSSMTLFLMAITWGGVDHPWDSAATLAPLIIGVVGTFVSIAWEKWGAREPFVRLAIFSNRSAVAGYFCSMMQGLLVRNSTRCSSDLH